VVGANIPSFIRATPPDRTTSCPPEPRAGIHGVPTGPPSTLRPTAAGSAFSPVHGFPQNGKVTDPDYQPYVTKAMVDEAHAHDITVIPWTVDDKPTMNKLIDDGVDGMITDYPDRLREVLADRGYALPTAYAVPDQADPLRQAHAHNDYEHAHPLQDALDHGFTSVEADVWLVDGQLLVAHDRDRVVPGRTLDSLYLSPFEARRRMNGGTEYPGWDGDFQLLVDVKSEAGPTWAALDQVLREHPLLMSTASGTQTDRRAVEAVVSGNRDRRRYSPSRPGTPATTAGSATSTAVRPHRSCHWSATTGPSSSPGTAPATCPPPRSRSCATSSPARTSTAIGCASGGPPTSRGEPASGSGPRSCRSGWITSTPTTSTGSSVSWTESPPGPPDSHGPGAPASGPPQAWNQHRGCPVVPPPGRGRIA